MTGRRPRRVLGASARPTSQRQVDAWADYRLPPVECVRPGLWSVPVECLEFPIRYTLAYLLVGDDGRYIIVDPGWDSGPSRDHLRAGIRTAGLSEEDLVGIVVTHAHPDHLALAPAVADHTGSWIGMHPREVSHLDVHRSADELVARDQAQLSALGVPAGELDDATPDILEIERYRPARTLDYEIVDGDRLPLVGRDVRAIWTPGHTDGHLSLVDVDNAVVLTGDHVLPRISPYVGMLDATLHDRNSIADYLSSLELLRPWDGYEVAPAHEYRFENLGDRLDELRDHTQSRSKEVAAVLREDPHATVWQIAQRLSWSRGWDSLDGRNRRAALGETNAHVLHVRLHVRL
ncbi:MBL fold metallo-hydrolase [Agromyces bauzanensis]|uniref:Metallo-beta-lactamase domain-containing protein n=1 Tax=Agromyces bauzanensis TaxID=1308924 RepID=A0A917P9F3_9MICO|nr:MBL fold metallo-hydrolase [Agromyces bauzanensis]GGJ67650.1 hypothetical protein GCM10011372_01790 [Agromyces bauzanensis]